MSEVDKMARLEALLFVAGDPLANADIATSVSYTHLDVYKRQGRDEHQDNQ